MTKSLSDEVMEILINGNSDILPIEKAHKAILKAVRERLPKKKDTSGQDHWNGGYNQAIEDMEKKLR